jgi:hypothetical protein
VTIRRRRTRRLKLARPPAPSTVCPGPGPARRAVGSAMAPAALHGIMMMLASVTGSGARARGHYSSRSTHIRSSQRMKCEQFRRSRFPRNGRGGQASDPKILQSSLGQSVLSRMNSSCCFCVLRNRGSYTRTSRQPSRPYICAPLQTWSWWIEASLSSDLSSAQ